MSVQRFLVRYQQSDSASINTLTEAIAADAASHGCLIRGQEDMSVVMGEICLAIETEGPVRQIADLAAAWKSHGLRVDNADSEVHELGDNVSERTEGDAQREK